MAARQVSHQGDIERLGEAHVGDRRIDALGRGERRVEQGAEGEDRDPLAVRRRARDLAPDLAGAERDLGHLGLDRDARAGAARIANGDRMVLQERGVERLAALVLVGRRQHADVRDAAQVGDVERAGVGRAVGADQAAAVEREDDRQVLDRDVVDQLVVGALQEGRVDRDHRLHALAGEAGGEGDGVLLGDADVEVALREALVELDHARAFPHRRRDADQALVLLGHVAQPLAEDLREGRLGGVDGLTKPTLGSNLPDAAW
jgi:hypothetical protein